MAERQARTTADMAIFQRMLSLEGTKKQEDVDLPCNNLPISENNQLFGREEIVQKLEDHLKPADTNSGLSSVVLYGLGGIGKTQIALAYAYKKLDELDAVFWIEADNEFSMQQSFSCIALDALKIPEAQPKYHQENMILVIDWLQKTTSKWLLIFDNVDSHHIIENLWPISKHGAIIVTTREEGVATLPIDIGIKVNEFDVIEGAKFMLFMSPKRRHTADEGAAAHRIADILGGLPLALGQMAALINAKNYTMEDFEAIYDKHDQGVSKQKEIGWKPLPYDHVLDTVWQISFSTLGDGARACLGVLSFLAPDSVPAKLFQASDCEHLPPILSFCKDELSLVEVFEELSHHSLLRRNTDNTMLRIHRLVQTQFRARMENPQENFNAAIRLLLEKFPSQRSSKFDDEAWLTVERYILQVLALAKNYNESQSKPNALQPNMDFVRLLGYAANAIHDNDIDGASPIFLDTASAAYALCPEEEQDQLLWSLIQYLQCIRHFCTGEFLESESEMTKCLEIRQRLLPADHLLVALAYVGIGQAVGAQGRYLEGLEWLQKGGEILKGPAPRKIAWGYNTSRNLYCMGRFEDAEKLLREAFDLAKATQGWYNQAYGYLTFASLRTRMDQLDAAKDYVDKAQSILQTSGSAARFSWLSSYCAYRAGVVAILQGRTEDAIQSEMSVAIGKLVKLPKGILCRSIHAYSKALGMDPSRQEESEVQRVEARQLRSQLPGGGGNPDDESDAAFERLVKMDQR